MPKSFMETARNILLQETAASETLKPKSQPAEGPQTLGGPATVTDQPKAPGEGDNAGAIAASVVKKDTSAPTKTAKVVSQSVNEKQPEIAKEEIESVFEDYEITEELAEFIDKCIAEGKSIEEINQAIEENFELVEEDQIEESKEEIKVDMSEHVNALFAGEEGLSEEFRKKATTIFESAVKEQVEIELTKYQNAYASALEEEVEQINQSVATKVDDYLNLVVEQWVQENEVAIDSGLRTEITEEFISGLRNLFVENYIDIPEDKVNVVEELASKLTETEQKLNESIEANVSLNKLLNESKKVETLTKLTEGLTDTQAAKLISLAEGINFTSEDEFSEKVTTLRESYFPVQIKASNSLDNTDYVSDGQNMIIEEHTGPMNNYIKALGKSLPKVK